MSPRTVRVLAVGLVLATGTGLGMWVMGDYVRKWSLAAVSPRTEAIRTSGAEDLRQAVENWQTYDASRAAAETRRLELAARWQSAPVTGKPAVLREAATALSDTIGRNLAPFWYGTPWDFNGTSQTPGQGCIACGYFVSTLLKHSGMNVERVRLAQQASQNIILTLTAAPYLYKGHGMRLEAFAAKIKALGPGLSIVGLDNHVGILWHDGSELWFLHSTVAETRDVIKERASESRVLANSKYRIAGQITADPALIEAWLTGRALPTWKSAPRPSA
jgi:hypothetical protein